MTRRKVERTIYSLRDAAGEVQTSPSGIARTMTSYLREKYDTIEVDARSIHELAKVLHTPCQKSYAEELVKPFEKEEFTRRFEQEDNGRRPALMG